MMRYVDGRARKLAPFIIDPESGLAKMEDGTMPTEEEIEALDKKMDEFYQKNSLVKQQIFSTIMDRLLLCMQKLELASRIWAKICNIHEGKTELVQIDLCRCLQDLRCDENTDVKVHFAKLLRLHESLAGMGASVEDRDFHAIILGSLQESYRPLLSSINATAKILQTPLSPYELLSVVSEEYKHRLLTDKCTSKRGSSSALTARGSNGKGRSPRTSKPKDDEVVCFNCEQKGHYKTDCWQPGGGKEGQGPNQHQKKGKRQVATAATESEPKENYVFATSDLIGLASKLNVPPERQSAIMDSGALSHFCPDRERFTNYVNIAPQDIQTADGTKISAVGKGDVSMDLPLGEKRTRVMLKDVLYAPKMVFTLISTNQIMAAGLAMHFEERMCKVLSPGPEHEVIAEISQIEGLYAVVSTQKHYAHIAKARLTLYQLHKVLGHMSQSAAKYTLEKGLITGVDLHEGSNEEFCEACAKSKSACHPFPKESRHRAKTYGDIIHTDLWGPAQMSSLAGSSYYMSFMDDYSRETTVTSLKQKSEALDAYKRYEARLTTQHGVRIKTLRSDHGGEYLSADFDAHLKDQGTICELTVHDSPQQNGVTERLNRTLVEHVRAMLLGRGMPKFLWAEAVSYAVWLKNHLPSRSIPSHTPFELVHGRYADVSVAHEFGTTVLVNVEKAGKLELHAEEAQFVGVDTESKGYRVYWESKRWVSVE